MKFAPVLFTVLFSIAVPAHASTASPCPPTQRVSEARITALEASESPERWRARVDGLLAWHERSGAQPVEHDALARYALTYLTMYEATEEDAYACHARQLLERLSSTAYRREGFTGWGLSYAYDAFQDGLLNAFDTIYGYTTSTVAFAFQKAFEVLGDSEYRSLAETAAYTLVEQIGYIENGDGSVTFRYSDQPADREFRVANISAIAAAALILTDFDVASAERALFRLVDTQGDDGNWQYWDESPPERTLRNDPAHWGIITTSLYQAYAKLNRPEFLNAARRATAAMKHEAFQPDGTATEYTGIGWTIAEPLRTLTYAYRIDGDPFAEPAFDALTFAPEGYVETVTPIPEAEAHARAQSWYAWALAEWYRLHITS